MSWPDPKAVIVFSPNQILPSPFAASFTSARSAARVAFCAGVIVTAGTVSSLPGISFVAGVVLIPCSSFTGRPSFFAIAE